MNKTCPPAPSDKKKYIEEIGKELIKANGKKEFYSPDEVKKAHKKESYYTDFSCWGMSTFCSHQDFDNHHQLTGEVCNYSEMKAEMISGVSSNSVTDLLTLPDFDIDMSWLELGDFGDTVGTVMEGIGSFFSGLADFFE